MTLALLGSASLEVTVTEILGHQKAKCGSVKLPGPSKETWICGREGQSEAPIVRQGAVLCTATISGTMFAKVILAKAGIEEKKNAVVRG